MNKKHNILRVSKSDKKPLSTKVITRKSDSSSHVTKSGKTIKLHQTLAQKYKAKKDKKAIKRAEKLALMPKSRFKRFFWRLHPKRVAKYWFSREGVVMGLKLTGIGIAFGFIMLLGIFAYFRKDLPDIKDITASAKGGSVRYYDKTGQTLLWEDFDSFKRIPIKSEDISQYLKDATVAAEDRDYYNHGGFNFKGIVRATLNNAGGGTVQGGSTITQQLVSLTQDWRKERNVKIKIKELILAVELERSNSKSEILAAYLNLAPYGGLETGVETAAQTYFKKSAKDLTLDEASILATIPKSPNVYSFYSPYFDKDALIGRQKYVLDGMLQLKYITQKEHDDALKIDVIAKIQPRTPNRYEGIKAPYFVLAAKQELQERGYASTTITGSGWRVTTTLDLTLQNIAEEELKNGIKRVRSFGGDTAAFAAEDVRNGQMVALVGGPDFADKERAGEINFATQFLPPGSSFKPYDYSALIENTTSAGAGAVLFDTKAAIDGYPCTNPAAPKSGGNCLHDYDLRFPGPLTVRYALAGSRNVPAVKAMLYSGATPREGIDKTINTAKELGLKSGYHCYDPIEFDKGNRVDAPCYASSAIGDGAYLRLDEHVHGYASLSRNGKNIPQTYILKIENFKGKVIDEWKMTDGKQAVRPDTAYIIGDILSDPNASYFSFGFGKRNRINGVGGQHKISFKTGTTNDNKDGWMMGYSTYYAAGVWVGHHTGRVEFPRSVTMETMTDPIFSGFMKRAHEKLAPVEREKPSGVQTLPAFVIRSRFSSAGGEVIPSIATDLFPSWYTGNNKKKTQSKPIDIVSNKTATDCTPPLAKKSLGDSSADSFAIDVLASVSASNQSDDIHKCDDVKPTVGLVVTKSGQGLYALSATINQGTHPLSSEKFKGQAVFKVNGQAITNGTFEITSSGNLSTTYSATDSGSKTFSIDVTDSVLYQATDQSVVEVLAGTPFILTVPGGTLKAINTHTFSWSSVSSADQYSFCYTKLPSGSESCIPSTTLFVTNNFSVGEYSSYVKALLSGSEIKRTDTGSFKIVP